jgi:flagellar protein FlbD
MFQRRRSIVIRLTRLNHGPFMLNPELIEHLEITPDTVITLTNGQKFVVLESADEVRDRIIDFRRQVYQRIWQCPTLRPEE